MGSVAISAAMVVIMMGAKTRDSPLIDGLCRGLPLDPFGLQGKIDHHDGVLFDDTDKHDNPHQGVQIQVNTEKHQGQ
jgi:hypothetical protein